MKLTLPLAAALLVGAGALVAVQALPLTGDASSGDVVQIAAKAAKSSAKGGKAGGCRGAHMYWSAKDKKCMDARVKQPS